jgi:hypothetical protein
MIPILDNHDWNATPIGIVGYTNDGLYFHFIEAKTNSEIFDILGNVGFIVLDCIVEKDDTVKFKYGRILEWSR